MWKPSREAVAQANLTAFLAAVRSWRSPAGVYRTEDLYRWSIDRPEEFWSSVWRFCEITAEGDPSTVVRGFDRMPGASWFPHTRLNFAENLLKRRDDHTALVFWNESGRQGALSYRDLYRQVAGFAAGLRAAGVRQGDRVAAYMPNRPETVVAMLAASSLGALWSSCSPDFGAAGVRDRFGQIKPKILLAADGYFYNGKRFDSLERIAALQKDLPSVERTVLVPYTVPDPPLDRLENAQLYDDFLSAENGGPIPFERLAFDHPLYIMYSSGTTGLPKCMVHGAGGTLLQHLKELVLHTDLKPRDRIFYFTTCGWMMWNWLVSSLAVGATVALYDGSPFHPTPGRLFDMAEQEGITVFGVGAKYLASLEKTGLTPAETHDLGAMRAILSTGSPLTDEGFDYVYGQVKSDVQLASISGGTDLISCFALGDPTAPVYRGELQTRGLGMKVEVFDDDGHSLGPGEKGELVCSAPFPSAPLGFWNDPGGKKYRAAYFERFPGVWHHGDYCELTEHGGMKIWGRSDAVLNPGGVRIGTAEIYRVVEKLPPVLEALAVGQDWDDDVRVILFLKLRAGARWNEQRAASIRERIRRALSPRHVPAKIIPVADLPRTLNGKIAELAVRRVIHGLEVKNRESLANPEALDFFRGLPDLAA